MPEPDTYRLVVSVLKVSGPTFGWVLLGVVLRRLGVLSPRVVDAVARFAFRFALPLLLLVSAAGLDFATAGESRYLLAGVLLTLLTLGLSWLYGHWRGFPRPQLGVFVQATFRSNLAIVGLALCHAAYGERGLVLAALPVAMMTALYNVLAVWVLQSTLGQSRSLGDLLLSIMRNPLLIGIAAGLVVALSGQQLPGGVERLGAIISSYFLPLTLVCIGGSMQLASLRNSGSITWEASLWRLLVAPTLGVLLALALGVRDEPLGVLFLLVSSPVAAASFVMVVAARGDGTLAANIIVLTTLLSMVTVTVGFSLLVLMGLVGELG